MAIVATLAAGSGYVYLRYRFGQIKTQPCASCVPAGKEMTVMVVGSDSRANLSPQEAASFCEKADCSDQAGPEHSDTLLLLHVGAGGSKATVLSIPRDTNVAIAGTARRDRINTAFSVSPDTLITTIRQNFGIEVNHYVVVDFVGFRRIVAAVGGIDVYFAAPARDAFSGLNVAQPGCNHLDGDQALGYVRSRHYEYFESGSWHPDPYSDLSRIQRQQDFIRRVVRKALAVRNPFTLNHLIDAGLSQGDLLSLGRRFRSLSPDAVDMFTLPTDPITVGGAAELKVQQPDASLTIQRFLQQQPPPAPPASAPTPLANQVRVRVLNGSGRPGQATDVAKQLADAGFAVAGTGDASAFHYADTVISYGSGQQDKASSLQARLRGPSQLRPDPSLRGVDAVVITGTTFAGVTAAPAPVPAPNTDAQVSTTVPQPTPGGPPPNRGAPPQPQC
ncbi:MAG: LCP family protein [Actinomycetota bacterium]|nr:LCP family protein [Actinomycetota bacterium]